MMMMATSWMQAPVIETMMSPTPGIKVKLDRAR